MNTCMLQFATQAEQDAAREEWFATRDLRRKEREDKEEKRKEQEKFHREWVSCSDLAFFAFFAFGRRKRLGWLL